jgi:hypothetical protein
LDIGPEKAGQIIRQEMGCEGVKSICGWFGLATTLVLLFITLSSLGLALTGHDWQSLYHFTIGAPVEDLLLRTAPPHAHLERAD